MLMGPTILLCLAEPETELRVCPLLIYDKGEPISNSDFNLLWARNRLVDTAAFVVYSPPSDDQDLIFIEDEGPRPGLTDPSLHVEAGMPFLRLWRLAVSGLGRGLGCGRRRGRGRRFG